MRTECNRARSLADVFVGPRCKGVGRSGPSVVFASKPTPVSRNSQVPFLRFSFRDHLRFVGRRKYRTRCDRQFARHISLHTSPFQLVFEPSKCPKASTETSVHSKKTSVRSKKKGRIQRRRFERGRREGTSSKEGESSKKPVKCSSPTYSYTRINCPYSYKDKPNKQHYNHFKNTTVVRFSALVDLATEISAILPLWRLKLSVYFHLGEYY